MTTVKIQAISFANYDNSFIAHLFENLTLKYNTIR